MRLSLPFSTSFSCRLKASPLATFTTSTAEGPNDFEPFNTPAFLTAKTTKAFFCSANWRLILSFTNPLSFFFSANARISAASGFCLESAEFASLKFGLRRRDFGETNELGFDRPLPPPSSSLCFFSLFSSGGDCFMFDHLERKRNFDSAAYPNPFNLSRNPSIPLEDDLLSFSNNIRGWFLNV